MACSPKITWSKSPSHTDCISPPSQVTKSSPKGSRRRSAALYPSIFLVSGEYTAICPFGTRCLREISKLIRLINRDTVASVGALVSRSLPFVNVNTTIRVFRHALSLDEVCNRHYLVLSVSLGVIRISPYIKRTSVLGTVAYTWLTRTFFA